VALDRLLATFGFNVVVDVKMHLHASTLLAQAMRSG
jgi:hypothetical protein